MSNHAIILLMKSAGSTVSKLLGENVQKFRKKMNLTQNELSEKIGISQKHLSDIETGTKFPSSGIIEKISGELNVSVALLFGGSDAYDISNKVTDLVMDNLRSKLQNISNDLNELKKMMKSMRITIQTE